MSKHEFPELTGTDATAYEFLERNKDLDLTFNIRFLQDLGIQVRVFSDDTLICSAGDSISLSTALDRALARTEKPVKEYRDEMARND